MSMTFVPAWTGGIAMGGNGQLSDSDKSFIAKRYPK